MTKLSSLSLLGFKLLFHPGQTQTLPLLATPEKSFAPTDSISKCPLLVSSASCLLASFKYFSPALSFSFPPQANSETSTCQYQDRQTVDKEKSNQLMSIKTTWHQSYMYLPLSFSHPTELQVQKQDCKQHFHFFHVSVLSLIKHKNQDSLNWRFYQPSNEDCDSKAKEASPCIRNPKQRNS